MQLSVKDLSKILNITERTIYRWIKQKNIPFYRIHDQYRFNRIEILDWATTNKMNVSQELIYDARNPDINDMTLLKAIKDGGIYYRVEGKDKKTLLATVIDLFNLPEDVKKTDLLDAMLVREELGSTGFGDGIAIPHARHPVVLHINNPLVSICFLEKPVDYNSLDNKPVNCLITLISPTVRSHLKMISRIAYILNDSEIKNCLIKKDSRMNILRAIERAEKTLNN